MAAIGTLNWENEKILVVQLFSYNVFYIFRYKKKLLFRLSVTFLNMDENKIFVVFKGIISKAIQR